jgi:hypothetical protein
LGDGDHDQDHEEPEPVAEVESPGWGEDQIEATNDRTAADNRRHRRLFICQLTGQVDAYAQVAAGLLESLTRRRSSSWLVAVD